MQRDAALARPPYIAQKNARSKHGKLDIRNNAPKRIQRESKRRRNSKSKFINLFLMNLLHPKTFGKKDLN
jgi:hypothetical protein